MKAILEFDLSDPDDRREHLLCIKANDMSIALWDIEAFFREELKYNEKLTEDQCKIIERIHKDILTIIDDHEINFVLEG